MSPRLRPGLVVLRRDDSHLQLGLEPPRRVTLPDVPDVRRLLDALQQGQPMGQLRPAAAAALTQIEQADLLAPSPPGRLPTVALGGPPALTDLVAAHLRSAGFRVDDAGRADAEVHVLLAHGVLRRELTDPLMRDGVPHLVAVATPFGWDLGPFVSPGETACLRCVDAAHRESDPRHGLIVDQIVRAGARAAPGALSAPLAAIALGWLARDLLAYAEGRRPTTWSTTVQVTEAPSDLAGELVGQRRWLRHPHCGCAWDALTG